MLSKEEAIKQADAYLATNGKGSYAMRSCWNCNEAHEHLKDRAYPISCPWCGHWYFKGVDITADLERANADE
jgi:hypothetical protein